VNLVGGTKEISEINATGTGGTLLALSVASAVDVDRQEATPIQRTGPISRWHIFLLGALVVILYFPVLKRLALNWWQNPDYSHGFVVPLFAAYVLWRTRSRWQKLKLEPSNSGLLVMIGALALLIAASLAAELFTSRASLLILVGGMVVYLAGWKMLRAMAFPLTYLLLMIPLPVIIYTQLTFPLQLTTSHWATSCLQTLHIPVLREGNLLVLPNYTLEVVEACSGIRSLMSLIALAVAYGYLIDSRRWMSAALVAVVPPVAMVSNSLRVVGAGVLTYSFGPKWAEGFLHFFSGWLIFLTALVCLLLAHSGLVWVVKLAKKNSDA
jgi:exosortase